MDIADIGFRADTSQLEKAALSLDKLKVASNGVSAGAANVERAVTGASVSIATAKSAEARATLAAVQASKESTRADISAAKEALRVARAQELAARAISARSKANELLAASTMKAATAESTMSRINRITGVSGLSGKSASESADAFGVKPANDQMPNRFNTGNIAAQFQDIGVTAAMGMNPLMIAMQQGTQLSAILNSMESPLKGIAIAFKSILNPISLMSIGLVALVAALIQFTNWTSIAQGIVNGLASVIDFAADHMTALLLIIGFTTIGLIALNSTAIAAAVTGFATMGAAALAAGAKMAAAWVIAMGPVGWVLAGIASVIALAVVFHEKLSEIFGYDLAAGAKKGVNDIITLFVGLFNGTVELFKQLPDVLKGIFSDAGKSAGQIYGEAFAEAAGKDWVGAAAEKLRSAADGLRESAKGFGTGDGKKKGGKTEAERYQDIIDGAERTIHSLEAERQALGMTAEAADKLKRETDLLNEAQQKNITLSPAQAAALGELAGTMARIAEETRVAKEATDLLKDAGKGFISDLRAGLEEGKSLWESFAAAAKNAIDKIIDKMISANMDKLFEGLSGAGAKSGTGGSIFSTIGKFLGLADGGVVGRSSVQEFAKGGTFTNSVVSSPTMFAFANGGAFGVMGEAGPEAVMPLHRGSDGSLGVKMNGMQAPAPSNETNNQYTFNVGTEVNQRDILTLKQMVLATAGPGVTEERILRAGARGIV